MYELHTRPEDVVAVRLTACLGATAAQLRAITPQYEEWQTINTNVCSPVPDPVICLRSLTMIHQTYRTDGSGAPVEAMRACKEHGGCHNSDLKASPPRYASCWIPDKI